MCVYKSYFHETILSGRRINIWYVQKVLFPYFLIFTLNRKQSCQLYKYNVINNMIHTKLIFRVYLDSNLTIVYITAQEPCQVTMF